MLKRFLVEWLAEAEMAEAEPENPHKPSNFTRNFMFSGSTTFFIVCD